MAKIYIQNSPCMWGYAADLGAAGSTSGSDNCSGYARITGLFWASASVESSSGLRIWQSSNGGTNWDYWSDYVPTADSGSAFSLELVGNAVKVQVCADNGASASVRTVWHLRPV